MEMRNRRMLSLFIALVLSVLTLSGCGNPSFTAKDFLWDGQVTWKTTRADIKQLYSRSDGMLDPLSAGFGRSLEYHDIYAALPDGHKKIAGITGFFITFDFMEESDYLKSIELFKSSDYSVNGIRSDFETLKKAYAEKYGEPTETKTSEKRETLTWDFNGMVIALEYVEFKTSEEKDCYAVRAEYKAQTEENGYQALGIPKNNLDGI